MMDKIQFNSLSGIVLALFALVVTGCGGGGGGGAPPPSGPVTSTLSFPLLAASETETASGSSVTLTANGTPATEVTDGLCSGTLNLTVGPANTATTFEGAPAFSFTQVLQMNFTNCVPASVAETATGYVSSTYAPLGFQVVGGDYGVYAAPAIIPASVKVGDVGIVGTINTYTDSSKTVGTGRHEVSFVVEPDTATTAIINLITKGYNASSQLLFTEQDRWRITESGSFSLVSIDIQYATTSTVHLVFR
jgi:hypothetical protein